MKKLLALLVTAVLAVSLVACGSAKIDSMTLPESQILNKGDSIQLTPTFASEKEKSEDKIAKAAEKLALEWASSNEEIATVDETGMVTAVGAGEADITAKIHDTEITASCTIIVEIKADGVNAPEAMEFTVGDEGKSLDAKVTPEDATNVVLQYDSSDENIATVDENGVVTPVSAGECVIKTSVVSASDAKAEAEDQAVVDAADEETADEAQAIASAETKVTVKAAEVKNDAATNQTSTGKANGKTTGMNNTQNGKANVPANNTHGQPAPSQSTTTPSQSGSTVNPTPAQPAPQPQPQPQPAPAPDPAPAPAPAPEPSKPSGENTASGRGDDGEIIEGGGSSEGNGGDSTPMPD